MKEIAVMGGEAAAFPGGLTATGSPSEAIFEGLMREVDMMRSLKHKHIVQYVGGGVGAGGGRIACPSALVGPSGICQP